MWVYIIRLHWWYNEGPGRSGNRRVRNRGENSNWNETKSEIIRRAVRTDNEVFLFDVEQADGEHTTFIYTNPRRVAEINDRDENLTIPIVHAEEQIVNEQRPSKEQLNKTPAQSYTLPKSFRMRILSDEPSLPPS